VHIREFGADEDRGQVLYRWAVLAREGGILLLVNANDQEWGEHGQNRPESSMSRLARGREARDSGEHTCALVHRRITAQLLLSRH
jgi:hypothetical protein